MDGQFPPPIPPYGAYYQAGPPPLYPPEPFQPALPPLKGFPMEDLGTYPEIADPSRAVLPSGSEQQQQPLAQRQRRRQPQGSEHVKHRRTRSGCYTCRQRRVKCDEAHPICERCRKGKRECSWPGSASSTSPSSAKPTESGSRDRASQETGSSGDEEGDEEGSGLPAIPDDEYEDDDQSEPQSATSDVRRPSDAAFAGQTIPSPIIDRTQPDQRSSSRPQVVRTSSRHTVGQDITQSRKWKTLTPDVRSFLKYHRDYLSYHHYAFKYDAGSFLKTTFLEIAMEDESEALLYGIVAFAAYHYAFARRLDGIRRFLQFYNQSITLLQKSVVKKRHNVATLLTILQLAAIEEFLGDWVNLMGHQRAAYQLMTELFTPQTIMQDETRRRILSWYIRFDLFASSMSGGDPMLGREWFAVHAQHYKRQTRDRPNDLGARLEDFFSTSRLLATDRTLLLAARKQNTIGNEQFLREATSLLTQSEQLKNKLTATFTDPSYFVHTFTKGPPPGEAALTDYRDPHFLYKGDLFPMNYVLIDFWAVELMFKAQMAAVMQQLPPPEVAELAMKSCKMFEAIQYTDDGPPGAILGCQASLGISAMFLPKERKYVDWSRRKFALIEQTGYIWPAKLREHFSGIWNEDVKHWWLPNQEGYPKLVRTLREFVKVRDEMPRDPTGENIKDMSGLFATMNISDSQSPPNEYLKGGMETDPVAFDAGLDISLAMDDDSPRNYWQ
ncbi:hypothetical protein BAUCODRAFT_37166 [Baudoinia panamericana UAMH 10762]|uniref:Zn(2)-C6 fungal-type domain-containing protein n=1 Tax=Baudoinia panamericana (strain UAMH 10762) TaxID=717646 RepID=M2MPV9_BAUPA|nr:uncharacterized protein BAUCODRAFT_37166 [Baudoinia panamericana UAMH 10762]EMC93483.1 hypothetical protein BAUCODRAFT_37166 [Baudoinia panamericana UAMH 10762]